MNVVAYIYLTITKLSRRTLCVPLRRSPLNEIHARLITCSKAEQRIEKKNTTCHQHFSNMKRTMNAIVSPTNASISTQQYLQQCSNNAEINSFWPQRFHGLLHLFNFFQHLGGKKCQCTIDHRKANKELTRILPEWIVPLNFTHCAAWKSGDVPTREGNFFFLFPRNALKTIHLVVHHPVNPLHAVGAWLSIFQGPRGVSRWLGWKNEWTMGRGRSAATSIGDRNWPAWPLVSQSRGARSKADRGANRWTRPNWISRTSRAAIRHPSVQFGRESCHYSLSATTASFIFVWPAVTPSSRRRTPRNFIGGMVLRGHLPGTEEKRDWSILWDPTSDDK